MAVAHGYDGVPHYGDSGRYAHQVAEHELQYQRATEAPATYHDGYTTYGYHYQPSPYGSYTQPYQQQNDAPDFRAPETEGESKPRGGAKAGTFGSQTRKTVPKDPEAEDEYYIPFGPSTTTPPPAAPAEQQPEKPAEATTATDPSAPATGEPAKPDASKDTQQPAPAAPTHPFQQPPSPAQPSQTRSRQPAKQPEEAEAPPSGETDFKKAAEEFSKKAKTFIDEEIANGDVEKFMDYCSKFGKSYINQPEFKLRLYYWKQADNFIKQNSWDANSHFKVSHNKFSDLSPQEYEKMLGYAEPAEKQAKKESSRRSSREPKNGEYIEDSMDWRDYGMVSPVINQGMCGSDWATAACGAVEGAYGVQQGTFTALSTQQLIDCTGSGMGCQGGTMSTAFDYLEKNYAMAADAYPYTADFHAQRGTCKYDASKATTAMVSDYSFADSGDVDMMKMALTHQPIAAVLNASSQNFQLYASGILDDEQCSATEMNHAVTLVGYGDERGTPYWIVKNTWGTDWGEAGYIKVAIKPGQGICGIQTSAQWVIMV